jgi:hypothetical protein
VNWKQTAASLEITGISSAPAADVADAAVFKKSALKQGCDPQITQVCAEIL